MSDDTLREDMAFAYRLVPPPGEIDGVLILLHGSATDETVLIPFAREVAPSALLVAVRGRILQDGERRWFRRVTPTSFEQGSIRDEAAAFAGFVAELGTLHGFDPRQAVFVGYSNGANLISSVMLLHPGLVARAALLRAMPVLEDLPHANLAGTEVLVVAGARDETYGPFAPSLVELLRSRGAEVAAFTVSAGHEFGAEDVRLVREWLRPRVA